MARFSKTAGGMKLATNDIVSVAGVKGKVMQVLVMKAAPMVEGCIKSYVDVLVVVDLTRGKGEPNVFNLGEIESVKVEGAWLGHVWGRRFAQRAVPTEARKLRTR